MGLRFVSSRLRRILAVPVVSFLFLAVVAGACTLTGSNSVSGAVSFEGVEPLDVSLTIAPDDDPNASGEKTISTQGTFVFDSLNDGTYRVTVHNLEDIRSRGFSVDPVIRSTIKVSKQTSGVTGVNFTIRKLGASTVPTPAPTAMPTKNPLTLALTPDPLPRITAGTPFSAVVSVTGGAGPYNIYVGGVPDGMVSDIQDHTARLSWQDPVVGTYDMVVFADSGGQITYLGLHLVVDTAPNAALNGHVNFGVCGPSAPPVVVTCTRHLAPVVISDGLNDTTLLVGPEAPDFAFTSFPGTYFVHLAREGKCGHVPDFEAYLDGPTSFVYGLWCPPSLQWQGSNTVDDVTVGQFYRMALPISSPAAQSFASDMKWSSVSLPGGLSIDDRGVISGYLSPAYANAGSVGGQLTVTDGTTTLTITLTFTVHPALAPPPVHIRITPASNVVTAMAAMADNTATMTLLGADDKPLTTPLTPTINVAAGGYAGDSIPPVTFTTADNNTKTFHYQLKNLGPRTFSATADGYVQAGTPSVTVVPDHFSVTPETAVVAGVPVYLDVTAKDKLGNTACGSSVPGTVTWSSGDSQAVLPAAGTAFVPPADCSAARPFAVFPVTYKTAGSQSATVSLVAGSHTASGSASPTVAAGAFDHWTWVPNASATSTTAGSPLVLGTVRGFDAFGNQQDTGPSPLNIVMSGLGTAPTGPPAGACAGGAPSAGAAGSPVALRTNIRITSSPTSLSAVPCVAGMATYSIGSGLTASGGFAVTAAAFDHWNFVADPAATTTTAGSALAVGKVRGFDPYGNAQDAVTGPVSVAVGGLHQSPAHPATGACAGGYPTASAAGTTVQQGIPLQVTTSPTTLSVTPCAASASASYTISTVPGSVGNLGTGSITVTAGPLADFTVAALSPPYTAGATAHIAVSNAVDRFGNPVAATLNVTQSGGSAGIAGCVPAHTDAGVLTVAAGSGASDEYTVGTGSVTFSISDGTLTRTAGPVTVNAGPAHGFAFPNLPGMALAGAPVGYADATSPNGVTFEVDAVDAQCNLVTSYSGTATLTASGPWYHGLTPPGPPTSSAPITFVAGVMREAPSQEYLPVPGSPTFTVTDASVPPLSTTSNPVSVLVPVGGPLGPLPAGPLPAVGAGPATVGARPAIHPVPPPLPGRASAAR